MSLIYLPIKLQAKDILEKKSKTLDLSQYNKIILDAKTPRVDICTSIPNAKVPYVDA